VYIVEPLRSFSELSVNSESDGLHTGRSVLQVLIAFSQVNSIFKLVMKGKFWIKFRQIQDMLAVRPHYTSETRCVVASHCGCDLLLR